MLPSTFGLDTLTSVLNSLPPDVNRFEATSRVLYSVLEYPTETKAQMILLYACSFGFIIVSLQCVMYFAVARPTQLSKWFLLSDHYMIQPNANNLFVFFSFFSGLISAAAMILNIVLFKQGYKANFGPWVTLSGMRNIPLFAAAWFYMWSTLVFCIFATRKYYLEGRDLKKLRALERRMKIEGIAINSFATFGLATGITMYIIVHLRSGDSLTYAYNAVSAVCRTLERAAPTYDPDTFTVAQLIPFLFPLLSLSGLVDKSYNELEQASLLTISVVFFELAVTTPTVILHLRVLSSLKRLQKEQRRPTTRGWARLHAMITRGDDHHALIATITLIYVISLLHVPNAIWGLAMIRTAAPERLHRLILSHLVLGGCMYSIIVSAILSTLIYRAMLARWPNRFDSVLPPSQISIPGLSSMFPETFSSTLVKQPDDLIHIECLIMK